MAFAVWPRWSGRLGATDCEQRDLEVLVPLYGWFFGAAPGSPLEGGQPFQGAHRQAAAAGDWTQRAVAGYLEGPDRSSGGIDHVKPTVAAFAGHRQIVGGGRGRRHRVE